MNPLAGRLSVRRIGGLTATVAVLALAAVFVLPWFVPVGIQQVRSDSQAVGFSNRTAMVGLAAACIAAVGLAILGQRGGALQGTGVLLAGARVEPGGRVSRRLVVAAVIVTAGVVSYLGAFFKDQLVGDSAYYMNVFLRVLAGGRPYAEIEFTYGPLMLYLPLLSYQALRKAGAQPHIVYCCWVAICHAAGLLLLSWILDRIRLRARVKNEVFVVCALYGALSLTLSIAYTPLRFLLPYALFLGCLDPLLGNGRHGLRRLAPVLAVALAASLSPEMGVALYAALLSAGSLAVAQGDRSRGLLLGVGGLIALGVVAAVFWALVRASTLGAFAGGAFHLPVLPGPPALAFVGTMLASSHAVGSLTGSASRADQARHLGWLALSVVLIVPAFGRADISHVFWNGMGGFVLCAAAVDDRWRRGGAYTRAVGFVFVGAALASAWVSLPGVKQRFESPGCHAGAERLVSFPTLGYTAPLRGGRGLQLAEAGRLVPLYLDPAEALSAAQFKKAVGQMGAAWVLAVPAMDYARSMNAAASGTANADGIVFTVPPDVGDPLTSSLLLGFPLRMRSEYPVFDPAASFGLVLKRDWREWRQLDDYVLLVRRN